MACHAHDQASVWKTVDELLASAFIFGGRNARSEFSWLYCAQPSIDKKFQLGIGPECFACALTEMGMGL